MWLALVTGARRGELCALRWDLLDFTSGTLWLRTSISQRSSRTWEKDTKSHQQRRIALDEQTLGLLRAYHQRCVERAAQLGLKLAPGARIFSLSPDGSTWLKPDSVSQRYSKMCHRLGWDMHLHQLRHYSGTELIAAGVDIRTVAGRLGHGSGGATTLRVYSAWVSEADQRAAKGLADHLPELPAHIQEGAAGGDGVSLRDRAPHEQPVTEASAPYLRIAADLRGAISCGALKPGDALPTQKELAARYGVSVSTANRAITLLANEGSVTVATGRRTIVSRR